MIEYHYEGCFKAPSKCGLMIAINSSGVSVVLIELADNPGTSVTNCYEQIATKLVNENLLLKNYPKEKINWYEVHPADDLFQETQDRVNMTWNEKTKEFHDPKWTRLSHLKKNLINY